MRVLLLCLVATIACGKRPLAETHAEPSASVTLAPVSPPPTVPPVMTNPPAAPRPTDPPKAKESDEIPGAPAATVLPRGFADLTKTVHLEIKDTWSGLGATHAIVAKLERAPGGRTFTVTAKVQADDWPRLKETAPDPTAPRSRADVEYESSDHCAIRDERTGKCDLSLDEKPNHKVKKTSVDAAIVEAFLAEVATRTIDSKQDHATGMMWTDDYPTGHVAVWIPGVKEPIHLAYRDQRRHWRVDGAFLTIDPGYVPPKEIEPGEGVHKRINERYYRMLKNMGLEAWVKEVNARSPRGRL